MTVSESLAIDRQSPAFVEQVRRGLRRCGVRGGRLLVAVSGGPDSVALLRGLVALSAREDLSLQVGHVDHGLRGAESDREAAFVVELCERLGVGCDVDQLAPGGTSEAEVRAGRYERLRAIAAGRDCSQIAVGHTRNDQAETVLHHVLRGTGLAGLAGMRPLQTLGGTKIVRPMLEITRREIEQWLESCGQDFCRDDSNRDTRFTRNRLRHELLPLLEQKFNPRVLDALVRLAGQAGEAQAVIEALAEEVLAASLLEDTPRLVRLDAAKLADRPVHLLCECLKRLWTDHEWPRGRMGADDWQRAATVITDERAVDLPGGISIRRRGNVVTLTRYP